MGRTKLLGFKTYGRADRNNFKYSKQDAEEKATMSPLISWNEIVNKSDSFDKLTRSKEVLQNVGNLSTRRLRISDESGRKKKRLGLSLRKKCIQKKEAAYTQSKDLQNKPLEQTNYRYKPYPPCSPIEVPKDSNKVSKMLQNCEMIANSFMKVKEPDQEKIVHVQQNILDAKGPAEAVSHRASSENQCLLSETTFRNFKANIDFKATSTPTGQNLASTMKFPRSHSVGECNIQVSPSDDIEKLKCVYHSTSLGNNATKLQPHVLLNRLKIRKCKSIDGTYFISEDNDGLLKAESKTITAKRKQQSCENSSKMTLPTPDNQCNFNQVASMGSMQSSAVDHDHQVIKNESEATTVPIETQLSFTKSNLKSSLGQNCSLLQQSLMLLCSQPEILDFDTCFPKRQIKKCSKVGEGSYGEVFAVTINTELLILKVVPFKEDFDVSSVTQQKFRDIQNEALVSRELSNLRIGDRCSTFIKLIKTYCIKGRYPHMLLRAWQQYHREVGSENENPKVFDADQLFMVFVYENGGCDLEKYKFTNAAQVRSAFFQICCALAIAEEALHFEHRDLHWGNILVSKTDSLVINFKMLNKTPIEISSKGVSVKIIDYSICRMQKRKDNVIYTDLSKVDSIFDGQGDYQYEVYRMMKAHNNNNWQEYNPKSNIFWLDYVLEKLLSKAKRGRGNRVERKRLIDLLQQFKELVLSYESSLKFVDEWKNDWGNC